MFSPVNLTYQWYKNGEFMEGANEATLTDAPNNDETEYYLEVTPAGGSPVRSNTITVYFDRVDFIVHERPDITSIYSCSSDTTIIIETYTQIISEYIPNVVFTIQCKNDYTNQQWQDISSNSSLTLTENFKGGSDMRIIYASNETIIETVKNGTVGAYACDNLYLMTPEMGLYFDFFQFEGNNVDATICAGETVSSPNVPADEAYNWSLHLTNDTNTPVASGNQDDFQTGYASFIEDIAADGEKKEYTFTFQTSRGCLFDQSVAITKNQTVSVESNKASLIKIYPSVITNYVIIEHAKGSLLTITDMQGRLIYKKADIGAVEKVNASNWSNDSYIVVLQNGNEKVVEKVIKK
jgi:hypothetical protein